MKFILVFYNVIGVFNAYGVISGIYDQQYLWALISGGCTLVMANICAKSVYNIDE
jgi:hypothetical protein